MKKILMIVFVGGGIMLLSGCTKKYTAEVVFDPFTFAVTTVGAPLTEISQEQKEIFKNEENLYKIYTIMNGSGYSDSVLIHREAATTQLPLDRLMQLNMKKLESRLKGFKASSISQIDSECREKVITGYLQSLTFDSVTPKKKIYMNQYFLRDSDYLYIVSSSTESSVNSNGYKKGMKNIQCTK